MDETLNSVNAEQAVNVEPQETEQVTPVETVNAEKAEVATAEQEVKPTQQSAEENAKFAAIRREAEAKAREKARDEVIAEMYGETHGIRTYKEYQEAVKKQQEQEKLQQLMSDNIPEDIAKEIIESRKFREQYQEERSRQAEQERQAREFDTFIQSYPDVKADTIPEAVWNEFMGGKSLVDAYAKHENQQLKQQIAELQKAVGIQQKNTENSATGTGSLTGNGKVDTDYISKETFDMNKNDQRWVMKNLERIQQSRTKW